MHGGLRSPAPEKIIVRRARFVAAHKRDQVHAVEFGRGGQARDRDRSGGDIESAHHRLVGFSGGEGAGPRGEERRADAPVGEHAFFTGERQIQRTVPSGGAQRRAVVADKKDHGVVFEVECAQARADLANTVVHRRDHREGLTAHEGEVGGRVCEPRLRRLQRHVRRVVGEVEKKRLARVPVDEGERGVGLPHTAEARIGEALGRIRERRALEIVGGQEGVHRAAPVFVEALRAGEERVRILRRCLPFAARRGLEVPLADLGGNIAGGL